jgi:hypothetical protein
LKALLYILAGALAASACATRGAGEGGATDLPNRGIIPYRKLGAEEELGSPFVWTGTDPAQTAYRAPSAVVREGAVELYVEARGDVETRIERLRSTDGGLSFEGPSPVLPFEAVPGGPRAPSALWTKSELLLAFERGEGDAIELARGSAADALAVAAAPLLLPQGPSEAFGIGAPSLTVVPGGYALYYEARFAEGRSAVALARSGPDLVFTRDRVVLWPGDRCGQDGALEERQLAAVEEMAETAAELLGDPLGIGNCWDGAAVTSPEVRVATTAAGRTVYRMFYAGRLGGKRDLGFAASWDGLDWSRFAANPVLDDAVDELDPSNLWLGDRYHLYYYESQGLTARGVALAVNQEGAPSETF